jgi:rare lipoprotein A (peptidoglycan hydrolase)
MMGRVFRRLAKPAILAGAVLALYSCAPSVPPATPPIEPMASAAPQDETIYEEVGKASWYGPWHQGKKTASGEKFDQNKLTAAHPTLPLGTEAVVTNLENGRQVEVKINDRGPYVDNRSIDLSKKAAKELGFAEKGVAKVKIEVKEPAPDRVETASAGQ